MATEMDSTKEVGSRPKTSMRQFDNGGAEFEETRDNGTHRLTSIDTEGTVHRLIERTDAQSGITTKINRYHDGHVATTIESPGGEIQQSITYPDGTKEGSRSWKGPDGTSWTQSHDVKGRLRTTHDTVEPDGTLRHTVKTYDGNIEVTRTKSWVQEDLSRMSQTFAANGDITTKLERPDGTSDTTTLHPDGTDEVVAVFRELDGTLITRTIARDGSETVDRQWTSEDGHEHRQITNPDGSTRNYENWEDELPGGATVSHHNGPLANETVTTHPGGSYEVVKNHSDGSTSTFTRTKHPDGSIDDHHTRRDGTTSESHYEENSDGSFETRMKDYDGTETTTTLGQDGYIEVKTHHADGTTDETSYYSDGSGRTEHHDANGHITGYEDIQVDPAPVPRNYADPSTFQGNGLRELGRYADGKDSGGEEMPAAEADGFGEPPLSQEHMQLLEEQGIDLPDSYEMIPEVTDAEPEMTFAAGEAPPMEEPIGGPGKPSSISREFDHKGPDGIHMTETTGPPLFETKGTVIWPDGSSTQRASRANASTGLTTEVVRDSDGSQRTKIETPTGERQETVRQPDGSEVVTRTFPAPDGSSYRQFITAKGTRTIHETHEPDGTFRTVEKSEDGTVRVWTSKKYETPDGTKVSEMHMPNGDVSTMSEFKNGTTETWSLHPDGTNSVVTTMTDADGVRITTARDEDGRVSTTRDWTEQDGTSVRTVTYPDGHKDEWRGYEHKNDDGSWTSVQETPTEIVTTTTSPSGEVEKETQHADGGIDRYSFKKGPNGTIERQTLADGSTRETHFRDQGLDGSFTIVKKGFDGSETTTTMQMDGSSSVRKVNPDGTSLETNREPDGSEHTTSYDAKHQVISESSVDPFPAPNLRDFHPENFLEEAQNHLPPSIGETAPDVQTEPQQHEFTDAEVAELSARGIAGPDPAAQLDEATDNDLTPAATVEDADMKIPTGALGADLTKDYDPPEPQSVRFTDFETDVGTMRIHGVGDDVLVLGDDPEDGLIIHNVGPDDTLAPDGALPDLDTDGSMPELDLEQPAIDESVGDPEPEEVMMPTVPDEPATEDF